MSTVVTKKRVVRWVSYNRDKANLITSKWRDSYIVLNLGTGKKGIRQHKVSKVDGDVRCDCEDYIRNNSICKHQIAVWQKRQNENKKAKEEQKAQDIQKIIDRW